jgi:iron transport multicopper oxidase
MIIDIEWHVSSGLVSTLIEDPLTLQKTLIVPSDHLAACKKQGIPTRGNAAGNTKDFTDLSGENDQVPASNHG